MRNTVNSEGVDYFVILVALLAVAVIGVIVAVKSNENDKFAPIKAQIEEETRLMNIRVLTREEG